VVAAAVVAAAVVAAAVVAAGAVVAVLSPQAARIPATSKLHMATARILIKFFILNFLLLSLVMPITSNSLNSAFWQFVAFSKTTPRLVVKMAPKQNCGRSSDCF
jgi:hypothetical protein